MPKAPTIRNNAPKKEMSAESRRKQQFAIWDYYRKKNQQPTPPQNKGRQSKP